jgi:hypothetical protein
MTIDHTKFDYYEVHPKNRKILARCVQGEPQHPYEMEKNIAMLVHKLSLRNPKWTFIGHQYGRSANGGRLIFGFRIYEDKEELGTIRIQWDGTGAVPSYAIDNLRLQQQRKRGNFTRTGDLDKALKIIAGAFGVKKTDELVREALVFVKGRIGEIDHHTKMKKDRLFHAQAPTYLEDYIIDNWDTMRPILISAGMPVDKVDDMPVQYEAAYHAKVLASAVHTDMGAFVVTRGDDYIVTYDVGIHAESRNTKIYSTDTLPVALKRGIACLKLSELNVYLPDIGIRVKPDTYFVLAKMEEEE